MYVQCRTVLCAKEEDAKGKMSRNAIVTRSSKLYNDSFMRLRITPSISDVRLLQTLITHTLRSVYGEVNRHRVDILGCVQCEDRNARSSEAIVRTRADSVSYVAAAMTMAAIPPPLVGNEPMCIEVVMVTTDLISLG